LIAFLISLFLAVLLLPSITTAQVQNRRIRDVVDRALVKVEAEVSDNNSNHAPGFARRAQVIRDGLAQFRTDNRRMAPEAIVQLLRANTQDQEFLTLLDGAKLDRDFEIQHILHEWVSTGETP